MEREDILESLEYIRAVFPVRILFDDLVKNGPIGDEVHTIDGDDLAGACWHLNRLLEHFRRNA